MFWTALAGLLGSVNWLLVGGDAVSEPDDSLIVESEAGDLGSGSSWEEKKRESELESGPGEASLGRSGADPSGWLGRGSSDDRSPGAFGLRLGVPY